MQIADFFLIFNKFGSGVVRRNVTPPEYKILVAEHGANAGGVIIDQKSFKLNGEKKVVVSRDAEGKIDKTRLIAPLEELALLRRRYKGSTISKLYPGDNPILPTTFSEVGVNDDGSTVMAQEANTVEVINGDSIEVVPVSVTPPVMFAATDGVSSPTGGSIDPKQPVERMSGSPQNLAFATGPTRDDGGRAE